MTDYITPKSVIILKSIQKFNFCNMTHLNLAPMSKFSVTEKKVENKNKLLKIRVYTV